VAEYVDRNAGHAAGRAGHEHFAVVRRKSAMFHPMQRQCGGVASRAYLGRLPQADARRQRHDPVAPDPRILRVAAVVVHAYAEAVDDYLLARRQGWVGRLHDRAA
jgi:hypothetical protein